MNPHTSTQRPMQFSKEEMLRFIDFLEDFEDEGERAIEALRDPACLRMILFLVRRHLEAKLVTVTALAAASSVPYATAMRRIEEMIRAGYIVRRPRTKSGKTHSLHPSPVLLKSWYDYSRNVKRLIGQALGRGVGEGREQEDYFFGASYLSARIIPQLTINSTSLGLKTPLSILVHADPSFLAMENLKRQFEQVFGVGVKNRALSIDRLYEELLANAQRNVSDFDVVAVDLPWIGEFVTKQMLMPLDDLIKASGLHLSDFHSAGWNGARYAGQQYGIPIQTTPELLLYRKDFFADCGLEPPETTDQVIQAAKRLHRPNAGVRGIAWNGARGLPMGHTFVMTMAAFGQPVINLRRMHDDFDAGEIEGEQFRPMVLTDAGRMAAEYLLELASYSPLTILNMSWYERMVAYVQGEVAMAYGYTLFSPYLDQRPDSPAWGNTGYLPHPRGPSGRNIAPVGGYVLGIPSNINPERRKAAWDAVRALTSSEAIKQYIMNGSRVNPRYSVGADPEVIATSEVISAVDSMARAGQLHYWPRPPVPEIAEVFVICGNEMHDMVRGIKSIDAALSDTQNQIDALMRARGHY